MSRRPDPPPLRTDDVRAVVVGTSAWVLALLATLVWRDDLVADDRGWWSWACVGGIALGLLGLVYVRRRAAAIARDDALAASASSTTAGASDQDSATR